MPTKRHPKKEVQDAIETVIADPWWRFEEGGHWGFLVSEFSFTLALDASALNDSQIDALYRTVPGSTAAERHERVFVGIDRGGSDFANTVVSAIEDVERALPGVVVLAVEPEELVSQADIAQRRGRSRESVSQLVKGERGPGDFPRPKHFVAERALWLWREVETWFDSYEGHDPQARHDAFLEAVNAVLAVRHSRPALQSEELDAVRRLAKDVELVPA